MPCLFHELALSLVERAGSVHLAPCFTASPRATGASPVSVLSLAAPGGVQRGAGALLSPPPQESQHVRRLAAAASATSALVEKVPSALGTAPS